ncbi:MAG: AI-2E family transporter [Candidatus Omnitrophica bacterium]|nr:AI-2E family transporter [Candidatus Omnitrophota bacterium]
MIGILVLIWTLRAASTVMMPLAVAFFIVILVWPLQVRLEQRLSRALSVPITFFVILLAFAFMGTMLWLCANSIASRSDKFQQFIQSFITRLDMVLTHHHLPFGWGQLDPDRIIGQAVSIAGTFAIGTYRFLGYSVLVAVFVMSLLIDVQPFCHRLEERIDKAKAQKLLDVARNTTVSIQRFMLTRTLTSAITGLLTGLFAWAVGLDFAIVWAVTAFVLNYIPVLGAIVAVIPPTLVALIQPGSIWLAPVTLGVLSTIHFTVGNYVDPLLQSRYLSLPLLLVFFSIVFWDWMWGIPGVLLGVPMTMAIVITCQHFDNTRWVAKLLLREKVEHVVRNSPLA